MLQIKAKLFILIFALLVFKDVRISSYKPGKDGHSGVRLAGARCLNLPKKYWDYKKNYPVPVCAMRAGKVYGSVRFGDIAEIRRKKKDGTTWKHSCVVLDSGPYGCLDLDNGWHNCGPKTLYKGKLPPNWRWKSYIDVAWPSEGYPGGGPGFIRVLHVQAGVKFRREIVMRLLVGEKVVLKHESKTWKRVVKF